MNNLTKRYLLFLCLCIPTRALFAYLAKVKIKWLKIMSIPVIIIALSWIYLFLSGKRKVGAETFGEKIWWNKLRPVHAVFYLTFAILALMGNHNAWIILAVDVLFGLISFLLYHNT